MAQNVYDDNNFFDQYIEMREQKSNANANDLIEIPIFKTMLPQLKGKTIIDLGCGYGDMSRFYVDNGAKSVLGIDLSQNMIKLANEKNKLPNIEYSVLGL